MLFGVNESHHHGANAHQDAGNVSGHEQSGYGHAACYRGVHDECAGRGDQESGGSRGNVDGRGKGRVVALVLLDGIDTAAHGGCSCHG